MYWGALFPLRGFDCCHLWLPSFFWTLRRLHNASSSTPVSTLRWSFSLYTCCGRTLTLNTNAVWESRRRVSGNRFGIREFEPPFYISRAHCRSIALTMVSLFLSLNLETSSDNGYQTPFSTLVRSHSCVATLSPLFKLPSLNLQPISLSRSLDHYVITGVRPPTTINQGLGNQLLAKHSEFNLGDRLGWMLSIPGHYYDQLLKYRYLGIMRVLYLWPRWIQGHLVKVGRSRGNRWLVLHVESLNLFLYIVHLCFAFWIFVFWISWNYGAFLFCAYLNNLDITPLFFYYLSVYPLWNIVFATA